LRRRVTASTADCSQCSLGMRPDPSRYSKTLASHAWGEDTTCFPGNKALAGKTGYTPGMAKQVRRSFLTPKRLRRTGWESGTFRLSQYWCDDLKS
jgi:hypothetical protein